MEMEDSLADVRATILHRLNNLRQATDSTRAMTSIRRQGELVPWLTWRYDEQGNDWTRPSSRYRGREVMEGQ